MKLYKDYTREPYSFLVKDTTLSPDNPLRCRKKSLQEWLIEAVSNKIEQNKPQYDLDRETAKISALSPGNVSKYEFLTSKDVLQNKRLARKICYKKNI